MPTALSTQYHRIRGRSLSSEPRRCAIKQHPNVADLNSTASWIPEEAERVALAERVERALGSESGGLWFPPEIEDLYRKESENSRRRHLVRVNLVAFIVYVAFLASDYRMSPDTFGAALTVRLGIVGPAILLVTLAIHRGVSWRLREVLQAAVVTLTGISVVYVLNFGANPDHAFYDSGLILVFAFTAIVVRLRFWFTVASTILVIGAYLAAAVAAFGTLPGVMQHNITVLVSGSVFMLLANYALEREHRRAFLYGLRDRIHALELRESNDRLTALSHLDPLTGIPNRRQLDEHLRRLCRNADRSPFSLVLIDVDCFKDFNDFYGHTVGDDCLRRVAGFLQASLRHQGDRAARFGGEEFVVLLPATPLGESTQVADRIRRGVRDLMIPHERSSVAPIVTISAGVAWVASSRDPVEALREADAALYRAKADGRDRVCSGDQVENADLVTPAAGSSLR